MTTITLSGGAAMTPTQKTALRVEIGATSATDVSTAADAAQVAAELTASTAMAAHVAAADPHPGYLTPAEGDIRYAPAGISGATNLTATASPTGVTINSDTGTDAAVPAADGTNAGVMLPAQVTKLAGLTQVSVVNDLTTGGTAAALSAEQGKTLKTQVDGKATSAQGAKADTAIQPSAQLTQAAVTAATAAGVALLDAADAPAQRAALGLGTAATAASTAFATAAQGAKADTALQDLPGMQTAFTAGTPTQQAQFQASVSGDRVRAAAQKALIDQGGFRVWEDEIKLNPIAFQVMASPPTITITGTNTITGQFFGIGNQGTYAGNPYFSLFRASHYYLRDPNYPLYYFLAAKTVTNSVTAGVDGYATLSEQVSFIHTGSRFSFFFYGSGVTLKFKINDQYVSLTPTTTTVDGSLKYAIVDFAGVVDQRRIDIIGGISDLYFGGVYTDATDSISPAPRRGPRMVVMSDSFGEGTGNEVSSLYSWVDYLTEYLGWDDVVKSCVGGQGLLYQGAGRYSYLNRCVYDLAGANPDVAWICLSVNDSSQTPAALLAAAQQLVTTTETALGRKISWIFSSPTQARGCGLISYNSRGQNKLVRDWCATQGYVFVDALEQPLDGQLVPQTTTLTASVVAGASSIVTAARLVPGACYKFPDNTASFVRTAPSNTATVDWVQTAWPSGTVITQCGPSLWTGIGHGGATQGWGSSDVCISADSTHPTNRGHKTLGFVSANLFVQAVARR